MKYLNSCSNPFIWRQFDLLRHSNWKSWLSSLSHGTLREIDINKALSEEGQVDCALYMIAALLVENGDKLKGNQREIGNLKELIKEYENISNYRNEEMFEGKESLQFNAGNKDDEELKALQREIDSLEISIAKQRNKVKFPSRLPKLSVNPNHELIQEQKGKLSNEIAQKTEDLNEMIAENEINWEINWNDLWERLRFERIEGNEGNSDSVPLPQFNAAKTELIENLKGLLTLTRELKGNIIENNQNNNEDKIELSDKIISNEKLLNSLKSFQCSFLSAAEIGSIHKISLCCLTLLASPSLSMKYVELKGKLAANPTAEESDLARTAIYYLMSKGLVEILEVGEESVVKLKI